MYIFLSNVYQLNKYKPSSKHVARDLKIQIDNFNAGRGHKIAFWGAEANLDINDHYKECACVITVHLRLVYFILYKSFYNFKKVRNRSKTKSF